MISEFEQKLIDQVQYQENIQSCVQVASASKNPFFLCQYAAAYNWDDGVDIAHAIADNIYCDFGTALSLFWLAEGMCYLTGEVGREDYNTAWADLCEKLITRIPNGFYKVGPISYDPKLNQVQIYKYKKLGVPAVFYTPVFGSG